MEKIVAIVPELTVSKFLSNEMYTLIVTNKRSIFANLTKEMLNDMYKKARDDAKSEGKGFFGQWGAQMSTAFNYSEKYSKMKPDDILKEAAKNFEIKNEDIEKVKMTWYNNHETQSYYDVKFISSHGKHKFRTKRNPQEGLKLGFGQKFK